MAKARKTRLGCERLHDRTMPSITLSGGMRNPSWKISVLSQALPPATRPPMSVWWPMAAAKASKRHKKLTDWARQVLLQVGRWLPGRTLVVVADSGYAVIELCLALLGKVVMVSRLWLDARLFEPAPRRQPGSSRPTRLCR